MVIGPSELGRHGDRKRPALGDVGEFVSARTRRDRTGRGIAVLFSFFALLRGAVAGNWSAALYRLHQP